MTEVRNLNKKRVGDVSKDELLFEIQIKDCVTRITANPDGFKVVEGRSNRRCVNEEAVTDTVGKAKYSVSIIIPKSDTVTISKIKNAIQAAYTEGESKLKGNGKTAPPLATLKAPLRDGDTERLDDEAYANAYFVNANSDTAPTGEFITVYTDEGISATSSFPSVKHCGNNERSLSCSAALMSMLKPSIFSASLIPVILHCNPLRYQLVKEYFHFLHVLIIPLIIRIIILIIV